MARNLSPAVDSSIRNVRRVDPSTEESVLALFAIHGSGWRVHRPDAPTVADAATCDWASAELQALSVAELLGKGFSIGHVAKITEESRGTVQTIRDRLRMSAEARKAVAS